MATFPTATTGDLISAADWNSIATYIDSTEYLIEGTVNAADLPSTFRLGITTNLAGTGFPQASGFVTTIKHSASRVVQMFVTASSSLANVPQYIRHGYEGGGTDGWGPWRVAGGNLAASGTRSVTHTAAQDQTTAVTFPAGRFDTAANVAVVATVANALGDTAGMTVRTNNVTTSGFDLLTRASVAITATFNVRWVASQEPV